MRNIDSEMDRVTADAPSDHKWQPQPLNAAENLKYPSLAAY